MSDADENNDVALATKRKFEDEEEEEVLSKKLRKEDNGVVNSEEVKRIKFKILLIR
jgi:hypothetical protein